MTLDGQLTLTALMPKRPMRDTQQVHSRLTQLAGWPSPAGTRLLWSQPDAEHLLVQSQGALPVPDWAAVTGTSDYAQRLAELTTGMRVRFHLVANPVYAAMNRSGPAGQPPARGRRQALPPERWDEWLLRKLDTALDHIQATPRQLPTGAGVRGAHRVCHLRVLFAGTATVTDTTLLTGLVTAGVGKGKAYGCGLLVVTRDRA